MERIYGITVLDGVTGYNVNIIDGVDHTAGEHDHDFYEIFLILQGRAIHWRNNDREIIFPGTAAFVHPGDRHSYSQLNPGPFRMLNVAFSHAEWIHLKEFLHLEKNPWLLLYGNAREAEELAGEALQIVNETDLEIKFRRLRVLTVRILNSQPGSHEEIPLWLQECKKAENLRDIRERGVKALKELTGFSSGYLTRVFSTHTGLTPSAWVRRERLTESVKLLQTTDWDILRIAQEGGYGNLSHFYRQFKEAYQVSPGKFRREERKRTREK
jgi:AraC family cel operon transcriptional repressor